MLKRALCVVVFAIAVAAFTAGIGTTGEKKKDSKDPKYNNPTFVPTADEVIEKMFEMGKVNEKDVIFDLGCGDNRICFMAAKKFGARGFIRFCDRDVRCAAGAAAARIWTSILRKGEGAGHAYEKQNY